MINENWNFDRETKNVTLNVLPLLHRNYKLRFGCQNNGDECIFVLRFENFHLSW